MPLSRKLKEDKEFPPLDERTVCGQYGLSGEKGVQGWRVELVILGKSLRLLILGGEGVENMQST